MDNSSERNLKVYHGPEQAKSNQYMGDLSPPPQYQYRPRPPSSLRQVQRVTKRAVLGSKKVIWDSNDNAIDAAQSAVDQWEHAYNALRGLLVASAQSAKQLYGAAKNGAAGIEHGLWSPVRDWLLLPAFVGVERLAGETVGFLQSDQAAEVAQSSLLLARQVPFVGDNILAPTMVISVQVIQNFWQIAQYPIPARHQVRESVDYVLTGTKWALSTAGREISLYVKRADATITRTLSHTQWKVLGSGPYATLDKLNKSEVIDHLCERYFSLPGIIARYELAIHIRAHNLPLYRDLVLSGLLKERGGDKTKDDEWLSALPSYRSRDEDFLLMSGEDDVSPLWFRLPYANGKHPGKDQPWLRLEENERSKLEDKYRKFLKDARSPEKEHSPSNDIDSSGQDSVHSGEGFSVCAPYPTIAKWYVPDLKEDVLIDEKRHSISFFYSCPKCRKEHRGPIQPPLLPKNYGDLCNECLHVEKEEGWMSSILSPPYLTMIMRPNLWRFYGPGDEVRRATWFVDTQRSGLQPYAEDAQAVLEDAYLFLKWSKSKQAARVTQEEEGEEGGEMENALLTVQVRSPDGGEEQLVQFSSLTQATAINKGLRGAIALFKRRVYRGAHLTPFSGSNEERAESLCEQSSDKDIGQKIPSSDIDKDDVDIQKEPVKETEVANRAVSEEETLSVPFGKLTGQELEQKEVDHLVLIVHGIGEMLRSINLFGLANLSSIVDCCGFLRKNHAEVQSAKIANFTSKFGAGKTGEVSNGRVEYLPVEWHEAFSILSQRTNGSPDGRTRSSQVMMQDISLRTIPHMRAFANDTLLDVLYFMSAEHHDVIIDIVVNEMNVVVQKFRSLTGFNGKISVMGHSLGSIIAWDILSNQSHVNKIVGRSPSTVERAGEAPKAVLQESGQELTAAGSAESIGDFPGTPGVTVEAPEAVPPGSQEWSHAAESSGESPNAVTFTGAAPEAVFQDSWQELSSAADSAGQSHSATAVASEAVPQDSSQELSPADESCVNFQGDGTEEAPDAVPNDNSQELPLAHYAQSSVHSPTKAKSTGDSPEGVVGVNGQALSSVHAAESSSHSPSTLGATGETPEAFPQVIGHVSEDDEWEALCSPDRSQRGDVASKALAEDGEESSTPEDTFFDASMSIPVAVKYDDVVTEHDTVTEQEVSPAEVHKEEAEVTATEETVHKEEELTETDQTVRKEAGELTETDQTVRKEAEELTETDQTAKAQGVSDPELTFPMDGIVAKESSVEGEGHCTESRCPKLNFDVDNAFMLGSPIAVFLMVRNQRKPLSTDFSLHGCKRVFNIFHPYDPVAYRIEPLIEPRNADFEPQIMTHWNGGFRVQYQTKRLWRKFVETTWKAQQSVVDALEAQIAGLGLLDPAGDAGHEEDDESEHLNEVVSDSLSDRVVTGQLNQGRRIDYMLQEKEIENAYEYAAALAAHSCYWIEKDISLFVAREIHLSSLSHRLASSDHDEPQAN